MAIPPFLFASAVMRQIFIRNTRCLLYGFALVLLNNVVSAALDNTRCGNESKNCLFLKLGNSKSTAVAHCGLNL